MLTYFLQAHWRSTTGSSWPNRTWPPFWTHIPVSWLKVSAHWLRMPFTACLTWRRMRRMKSTRGVLSRRKAQPNGVRKRRMRKRRRVGLPSRCAARLHQRRGETESTRCHLPPFHLSPPPCRDHLGHLPRPPQSDQTSAWPPHLFKSLWRLACHLCPFQELLQSAPQLQQQCPPLVNVNSLCMSWLIVASAHEFVFLIIRYVFSVFSQKSSEVSEFHLLHLHLHDLPHPAPQWRHAGHPQVRILVSFLLCSDGWRYDRK